MQQTSEQKKITTPKNKGGFYMFNKFKHMKNEKGLTLIELLAVIVVLAIIAAIAIPAIGNIINNSKVKAEISDAITILNAAQLYETDGNALPFKKDTTGDTAGDYVDVSERITAFSVSRGTDGKLAITFTGTKVGAVTSAKTLKNLSEAKVSKGIVTW